MKKSRQTNNRANIPALVAVGSSLAAFPAAALELGELTVQSGLGQPLRASIAYALAPNEALSDACVTIAPATPSAGLPGVGPTSVGVANGVISLVGNKPLREPMLSARVVVRCPYTPNISREYMLFLDPMTPVVPVTAAVTASQPAIQPAVRRTTTAPVTATRSQSRPAAARTVVKDIEQSSRYQVEHGETLSEIAARIKDRKASLWPTVNALFEANPDAFIDNDPNKLKAGSWLTIPASIGGVLQAAGEPAATSTAVEQPVTPADNTDTVSATSDTVAATPALSTDNATSYLNPESSAPSVTDDLKPGSIVTDDNPFVEHTAETIVIPDTELEGPTTTSSSPNVTTAVVSPKTETSVESPTNNWLWWLVGGGVAAILALLLFGRRLRDGDSPLAPVVDDTPMRRISDTQTVEQVSITDLEADLEADLGYHLEDDSPTEENLVLDADLITGSGLDQGSEMDIAQDFGFATTQDVDIELPFESADAVGQETDILPTMDTAEQTILDNEVMPGDADYDMSVIVDATRMPQHDEVPERDLKAVEISAEDETPGEENYTINEEVDFHILEQDYEDELTATQALNEEIARAARELAERIESPEDGDLAETAALPMASIAELDVTAEMTAANSDEVIAIDDSTVEMPVDDDDGDTETLQLESGKTG